MKKQPRPATSETVAIKVPRHLFETVIKPMLDMITRLETKTLPPVEQRPVLDRALTLLHHEGVFLSRLIDLKPANRRAPWAAPLLSTLLAKMNSKGQTAARHRDELKRQLTALDEQTLQRLFPATRARPKGSQGCDPATASAEAFSSPLPLVAVGSWPGSVEQVAQ